MLKLFLLILVGNFVYGLVVFFLNLAEQSPAEPAREIGPILPASFVGWLFLVLFLARVAVEVLP